MPKFRKIPVEIEAYQYRGDRFEAQKWMKSVNVYAPDLKPYTELGKVLIPTLEGDLIVEKDSYIIMGVKGEFYACREDVFLLTYETV